MKLKMKGLTILALIVAMCALVAPAVAQPSTPFMIYGWVNYTNGAPVNDPTVSINNTNTIEVFTAETNESYNYYQTVTSSDNVSMGDILHFNASNGNVNEFNNTVTETEINSTGGFVQNITIAGIANHVVISEINITGDPEWVELYNPTSESINLDSTPIYLCYYASSKDWNKSSNPALDKMRLSGAISAYGFYLVKIDGITGTIPTPDHDWGYTAPADTLLDSAGSVGIFPWNPNTKTADEAKNGRIDAVGWGSAVEYVYETVNASVPSSGESLQRKVNDTINEDGVHGPAWDTNDNSADFFIQTNPNPQNSSYTDVHGPVPPIPELPTLILFSAGLIILAGYVVLKRRE